MGCGSSQCAGTVSVQPLDEDLNPHCAVTTPKDPPRCPQSATRGIKNCFLGAPRVTFRCLGYDICFLQKKCDFPWSSHILRLRAAPFSHSKSTWTRSVHQKLFLRSFLATCTAHVTRKVAPRQAQGFPTGPPGPHKAPLGHLKTFTKSVWDTPW